MSNFTPHPPERESNQSGSGGGIFVSEEELKAAFNFFDSEAKGVITVADLKRRLGAFYKNVPAREYRFLMNDQSELSLEDLTALLQNNEIKDFDPVAEAFKVYDPEGTGFVDPTVLKNVFAKLEYGEIRCVTCSLMLFVLVVDLGLFLRVSFVFCCDILLDSVDRLP